MKKLPPIVLLLLLCNASFAQPDSLDYSKIWKESLEEILQAQSLTGNKITQLKQRVIGIADSSYSLDSTYCVYSGTHGSQFYYPSMFYRSAEIDQDTSVIFQSVTGGNLGAYQRNIVHYSISGKKDTIWVQGYNIANQAFINSYRTSYQYNMSDNLVLSFIDIWNATTLSWTPSAKTVYLYNNNNQLIADTSYSLTGVTTPSSRGVYVYNASGKSDTTYRYSYYNGTWPLTFGGWYRYYPNGLLKYSESVAGGLNSSFVTTIDSFGYDMAGNYNYKKENGSILLRYLNASGVPDSTIYTNTNNSIISSYYQYNTYGNPITAVVYNTPANVTVKTRQSTAHYYYEIYNNNLAVQTGESGPDMILYPNPATTSINIQATRIDAGSTATIWNAIGQKIAEQKPGNNQLVNIPIQALTPGIYWLTLQNAAGTVTARHSFVKQ